MSKPIYVIGHRNPDTDSICSAIGYCHLKKSMGVNALPARAGKLNPETKFVLDYFNVEKPVLISDLYPRVKDIMQTEVVFAKPENTLRELGHVFRRCQLKSIPVAKDDGYLVGIVSVGDLAKRYFEEIEMQDLSEAGVNFQGVLRTLDGFLICGRDLQRKVTGRVRIAAATAETIKAVMKPGDIVLAGNRANAQLACISAGISCLIVTGNAEISTEIRLAADEHNVIIIRAPYDTYTCARLINQSIPVSKVMQENVVSFKPNELVSDVKEIIVKTKYRNYPVVDDNKLVGFIERDKLIIPKREKIILVDHNERTQAVEGIEEAHILEIVDHHRLGGLETSEPIFIRHEPVGSTATIVANMHWHRGVEMPRPIAGLLLAAIISDTVMFKSPTATCQDRETAGMLAEFAGLNIEEFGTAVLKAGSSIADLSAADIVHNDLKEFQMGEYHVAISQISVMDPQELLTAQKDILDYMEEMRLKEGYDMAALMVTDIGKEATHLIHTGPGGLLLYKAFGSDRSPGLLYLPGVMSRKKQVVPPMVEASRE